ncbi:MAG: diguanylate cyclase [Colwellia sp.]|nr:diguanylate cyclase [Colwellia sp.]
MTGSWVIHTYEVKAVLENIISELKDAETGQRGYLLTDELTYLEPYKISVTKIHHNLKKLSALTNDNSRQQQHITRLTMLVNAKLQELKETIELAQGGYKDNAIQLILTHQGKKIMDDIRIIIDNMAFEEKHLLSVRQQQASEAIKIANFITSSGGVLTLIFIGCIAFFTKREASRYIAERERATSAIISSEKMFRNLMESAYDGIIMVDNKGNIASVNERLIIMTGYTKAELIGHQVELLIPERFNNHVKLRENYLSNPYTRAMGAGRELCLQGKKGNEVPVEISLNPVTINDELFVSVLLHDISKQKQMEDELRYLACHDALTGLYSRNKMDLKLNEEIQRASRYKHTMSIFMLDIDHFKDVNDTYGHDVGDEVLKHVANEIERSIRTTDFAARFGGEEFIIILPETVTQKAEELAERLRNSIANFHMYTKYDKDIKLTVSIGIATYPSHAKTAPELLKAADTAMYAAKEAGRNKVMVT